MTRPMPRWSVRTRVSDREGTYPHPKVTMQFETPHDDFATLTDAHDLACVMFEALARRVTELERRAPRSVDEMKED